MIQLSELHFQRISLKSGLNDMVCTFKMEGIPPFNYMFNIIVSQTDGFGTVERLDVVEGVLDFSIIPAERYCNNIEWGIKQWGYHKYEDICIEFNADWKGKVKDV